MNQAFENRHSQLQGISGEAALYRLAELATEFGEENVASTARGIAEKVSEGQFYVACVGQFKRGKSTLLNALVGYAVLPTAVVPVTAVPTIIRHGKCLAARVRTQSATWKDIDLSAVEEYVSERKNPENVKKVVAVEISVPCPLLETGLCLVDTPGIGSVFAGNTAVTQAFIPHIDAAIVVIGTDPPLSGDELQLVETVSHEIHDLVFVLNKSDRANVEDRAAALEFARRVLETRLKLTQPEIFEVSALDRLEQRSPERDWEKLVHALEDMVLRSGRSLVHKATDRGIRRAANQLLFAVKEERDALEQPLAESERRVARLKAALEESQSALRDLGVLLSAEQQHLSNIFVKRRNLFLQQIRVKARTELTERLSSIPFGFHGPRYRQNLNHLAQEIAASELTPWLEIEAACADQEFRRTAKRFVELANEFLHRLGETEVPGVEEIPESMVSDPGLSGRSQFHFHVIERIAAPASPLLFLSDLLLCGVGLRGGIVHDAQEFLDQLLEVNSSRVQSDVDERLLESRKKLEAEIKAVLHDASAIADRALIRARAAQATGAAGVRSALARLDSIEHEVQRFIPLSFTP